MNHETLALWFVLRCAVRWVCRVLSVSTVRGGQCCWCTRKGQGQFYMIFEAGRQTQTCVSCSLLGILQQTSGEGSMKRPDLRLPFLMKAFARPLANRKGSCIGPGADQVMLFTVFTQ
jgi:hypothetical protein